MRSLSLLLIGSLVLTGCLPLVAGMAGAEAVTGDPDGRQRHLATSDRPDSIRRAINHQRVIRGMSAEEVKLVWGQPGNKGMTRRGLVYEYGGEGMKGESRILLVDDTVRAITHEQP